MTIEEYRVAGYAAADAIAAAMKAQVDAACELIGNAQVDSQREFGAVKVPEAATLLSMGESTVWAMVKDGRLEYVNERIPLWSIHELLHKTPAQRRKKPDKRQEEP